MQRAPFGHPNRAGEGVAIGGYVLAGGASRRMGTDKALLKIRGITLIEIAAAHIREAAGSVSIVADPPRYRHLGLRVIPDLYPGHGPLGGVITALADSPAAWNLIIACDMPELAPNVLQMLADAVADAPPDCRCIVPDGPAGPEPLCAVYHRSALASLQNALDRGTLKMRSAIAGLAPLSIAGIDHRMFRNINTPEDWAPDA